MTSAYLILIGVVVFLAACLFLLAIHGNNFDEYDEYDSKFPD
jgi:hypothetical protein